jgi:hypothetical protein
VAIYDAGHDILARRVNDARILRGPKVLADAHYLATPYENVGVLQGAVGDGQDGGVAYERLCLSGRSGRLIAALLSATSALRPRA